MLKQYHNSNTIEAGCDEAGRGCLAGPVFAAAVVLPKSFASDAINDSKQLSAAKRKQVREVIQNSALDWAVAMVSNEEIDRINILNASILAMQRAIDSLKRVKPQFLLIDGNRFKSYRDIPHLCVVKGDAKYQSIAAASILAKTFRDDYMEMIDKEYPNYGWKQNMGYPTKFHRESLARFGATPFHRLSFSLQKKDTQLKLPIAF